MKELQHIKSEIDIVNSEKTMALANLREKAQKVFKEVMKSKKDILTKMANDAENSTELTTVPNDDWYSQYAKADFSVLIDKDDKLERELLRDYMRDNYYVDIDFENNVVLYNIGPAIIVSHDLLRNESYVYDQDSGKIILMEGQYRDYSTVSERNKLIESYMEKTGIFPAVIEIDYYGSAKHIDTKE